MKKSLGFCVLALLMCIFASLTACQNVSAAQEDARLTIAAPQIHDERPMKALTPAQVYRKNVHAVVAIRTVRQQKDVFGKTIIASGAGTGFIINLNGYIVTNNHVVKDADSIRVTLYSGEDYDAELIGGNEENDIALLKISGVRFPYLSVGSSDTLAVGELIAAIGNPLGELTYSMTVGYVSALDRKISAGGTTINMLQTDAPINSGNSGGPVFDMSGKVIGVVSAKYSGRSTSGAYIEGLGFAIPIDDVLEILRGFVAAQ